MVVQAAIVFAEEGARGWGGGGDGQKAELTGEVNEGFKEELNAGLDNEEVEGELKGEAKHSREEGLARALRDRFRALAL